MGHPQNKQKHNVFEGISKGPFGLLSSPGRPLERCPAGPESFRVVSEDRWVPPGSSLSSLGRSENRPRQLGRPKGPLPLFFLLQPNVLHCFEHPDDPSSTEVCVNAPEPLHY